MNTLQSLIDQIEQVCLIYQRLQRPSRWRSFLAETFSHSAIFMSVENRNVSSVSSQPASSSSNSGAQSLKSLPPGQPRRQARSPILLLFAIVTLTGVTGQRFYSQPQLSVGTKAPQTIVAPEGASVVDHKTTEEKRREARVGAVSVLKIDPEIEQQNYEHLKQFLQTGDKLRAMAGPFPFMSTGILSTSTQQYLRQIPAADWQEIQLQVRAVLQQPAITIDDPTNLPNTLSIEGATALTEFLAYGQQGEPAGVLELMEQVTQARERYTEAQVALSEVSAVELAVLYRRSPLLNLSDAVWEETKRGMEMVTRRMLTQGIPQGLPPDVLRAGIQFHLAEAIPPESISLAARSLETILQPNLVRDLEATRLLAELAAQKVKPAMVRIEAGETIVQQGEEISQRAFVLLDHFALSRREINWQGLAGFALLVTVGVNVLLLVEKRFYPNLLRRRDHFLFWLLSVNLPIWVALVTPWTTFPAVGLVLGVSVPAIGILMGSFYGTPLALTLVALMFAILPVGLEVEMIYLVAAASGGILGGSLAGRLRSREELALLGGGVGVMQGAIYLFVTLIVSATTGSIWFVQIGVVVLECIAGLIGSIVAMGLSPYLEHLFDLITPIRLAELANPNRPLLKRLAAEAPGTFQHTLFVATLAEAAARELGCNVELVRTGTLYHDIGKMHDPQGFIENQMGGPNKHDEIDDPWQSATIIKKHVTEGLVMARKYRLPKAIRAFIPEHQGTMQIAYFYHKAKESGAEVNEQDFRYDGPIPQSRETGLVMLADSCEAALRSLKDVSHEDALVMVNKILRARWQDNQLVDSGLMRDEMPKIAEIFVRVWEQVNHKRIAYPKAALSPR